MKRYTIADFNRDFPTEEACLEHVVALVYPEWDGDSMRCRKCEEITKHYRIGKRKAYACGQCGTHVYPLAGTIFEKSTTPLKSWFFAMHLMSSTRTGVSAKHLERQLGVTYKTAWRMSQQIRKLLDEDNANDFSGHVEMDETYIGGTQKYGRGRPGKDSNKSIVAGLAERKVGGAKKGRVAAYVVPDVTKRTLYPLLQGKVLRPVTVFTDQHTSYNGLTKATGYHHKRINHSAGVYVQGEVHTNTIEGFWSLFKRSIDGAHHQIGKAHLQRYLNEYVFRYNHRDDEKPMFKAFSGRVKKTRDGQHGAYAPLPR